MKVWERGAGLTLACGTGACAAVVAAVLSHRIPPPTVTQPCRVSLPGGDLHIVWSHGADSDDEVYMTGPARFVFSGVVEC